MENILELIDVEKNYRDFSLNHVTFALPKGSIMGFVGANGAGKSTTIKLILNIIRRDGGEIFVFGKDNIEKEQEVKREIGLVMDDCSFHDALNAKDVSGILAGVYSNFDKKQFFSYLDRFRIQPNKKIKDYSRGMKMKLSIATALSHHAKLLIMDEPTSGLDPIVRSEILDLFLEFIQDEEHGVLLSSHITSDLEKICDYITFIDNGSIVLSEEKDVILDHYGIIKGGREAFKKIDERDIIGKKSTSLNCEALVRDRVQMKHKYPDLLIEPAQIEDIMVFIRRGQEA